MAASYRGRLPVLCFERSSKEMARAQLEVKAQPAAALPAQNKEPGGRERRTAMAKLGLAVSPSCLVSIGPCHRLVALYRDAWPCHLQAALYRGAWRSHHMAASYRGRFPVLCFERCSKVIVRAQLEGNGTSAARRQGPTGSCPKHKKASPPREMRRGAKCEKHTHRMLKDSRILSLVCERGFWRPHMCCHNA